jgi:uncharacterized BrkB/YihY/UPF0761 family membrane protein
MFTFDFWRRWLMIACLGFVAVGILVVVAGDSMVFAVYNEALATRFFPTTPMTHSVVEMKRFLFGPLGATIAGRWILMYYVIAYGFPSKQRWMWDACVVSLLGWFVIDSGASAYHRAWFNIVMINLAPLFTVGVPLFLVRREFIAHGPATEVERVSLKKDDASN